MVKIIKRLITRVLIFKKRLLCRKLFIERIEEFNKYEKSNDPEIEYMHDHARLNDLDKVDDVIKVSFCQDFHH